MNRETYQPPDQFLTRRKCLRQSLRVRCQRRGNSFSPVSNRVPSVTEHTTRTFSPSLPGRHRSGNAVVVC